MQFLIVLRMAEYGTKLKKYLYHVKDPKYTPKMVIVKD